jgi:hypothetical protein
MAVVPSVVIWVGGTAKGLVPRTPQVLAVKFSLFLHTNTGLECGL